jgi:hypothetical protein
MNKSAALTVVRMKHAGAWNALAPVGGALTGALAGVALGHSYGPSVLPDTGALMPAAPDAPEMPKYWGDNEVRNQPMTWADQKAPAFNATVGDVPYDTQRAAWQNEVARIGDLNFQGQAATDAANAAVGSHDARVDDQRNILSQLHANDMEGHAKDVLERKQQLGAGAGALVGGGAGYLAGSALRRQN